MYGTIARLKFDPADGDSLATNLMAHPREIDGFISGEVLISDTPGEAWLVVKFRDKESYDANANSPEQNERYEAFRAFLTEDPEWHDGGWIDS